MPEPIDWQARWQQLVAERNEQTDRWRAQSGDTGDFWDGRAAGFARMTRDLVETDPFLVAARAMIELGDTVLDVGAGAGRYAAALARNARQVVALDPSAGMLNQLRELIVEREIQNIDIVEGAWPDSAERVPMADVVICSHAMYWAPDIGAFARAMQARARKGCLLVIRAEQAEGHLLDLYPRILGEPRKPEPNLLDLYGALSQAGIWADVTIAPGFTRSYRALDDAVDEAAGRFYRDPEGLRETVRAYLEPKAIERDGRIVIAGQSRPVGLVSWKAGG